MTVFAEIGEDARFFALLLEALERALKVLIVMDYDFRQILLPPLVAFARRIWDRPMNVPGVRRVVKLRKPRSDMKLSAEMSQWYVSARLDYTERDAQLPYGHNTKI